MTNPTAAIKVPKGWSLAGFQACCTHDYKTFIDPQSGGFVRCRKCGHEVDCEGED